MNSNYVDMGNDVLDPNDIRIRPGFGHFGGWHHPYGFGHFGGWHRPFGFGYGRPFFRPFGFGFPFFTGLATGALLAPGYGYPYYGYPYYPYYPAYPWY